MKTLIILIFTASVIVANPLVLLSGNGGASGGATGLYLRYKLDEGTGTTSDDATAGNNDLTIDGATWVTGKSGSGYALSFDGTNDDARTANFINVSTNVITICAWVKTAADSGENVIFELTNSYSSTDGAFLISKDSASSRINAGIQHSSGTLKFRLEYCTAPSNGTWFHLAVVLDNSTDTGDVKIYIDGSLQSTTIATNNKDASGNFVSQYLYFAARNGATLPQAMDLDDFRIYSRELTESEIGTIKDNPDE